MFGYRICALLLLAALGSATAAAGEDAAQWRLFLAAPLADNAAPAPQFPARDEFTRLRANRAWLERWSGQPPSVAWNDVVAGLVGKYQHNPLRAARAYVYVHAAIHDALVQCARQGCEAGVRAVAMHVAAGRILDHLYPGESRGRMKALGHSAATAALAAAGGHAQAALAWRTGRAVADNAIRRAMDDGWDLPRLPASRPAWKPGVWRASPPLNMYDPADPNAGQWRTWVLKDGAEIEPPPPPAYDSPAYRAELEEVYAVQKALTAAQKRIVEDWNLGLGSVTP